MAVSVLKAVDLKMPVDVERTTSVQQGTIVHAGEPTSVPKVYQRRYFGLAQLFCLNLCSSIAWIDMASVVDLAAEHFESSVPTINWFSTSFLFAALVANYPASLAARHGLKFSMLVCSACMVSGTWLMYGGTYIRSLGLALFGHCLIAIAQPFSLILPAPYSEAWFRSESRTLVTAISSLANILGGTIGQYIITAWIQSVDQVPRGILYQSIMLSAVCCATVFIPARPPTPPGLAAAQESELPIMQELKALLTRVEFYLIGIPFAVLSGVLNALSFLIFQMCLPYGFTVDQCVNAGLLFIIPGLAVAIIVGHIADIFGCHLMIIKGLAVIMAGSMLAFIWVPPSNNVGLLYGICTMASVGIVSPVAVCVEFVTEIIYPLSPEITLGILWGCGQLLGGVLTIGCGYMTDQNGGLQPGVYFLVALAMACLPLTLSLGLWGRHSFVNLRRTKAEQELQSGRCTVGNKPPEAG